MSKSWRGWLAGIGVLVLLSWLYQKSSQIDINSHVQVVERFEQLRRLDANLNQYVLQSRYGLLRNYDPLIFTELQLKSHLNQLRLDSPDDFSDSKSALGPALIDLVKTYENKFSKIEEFKSHNAVLRNSVTYLPLAIHQLLLDPAVSSTIRIQLYELLERIQSLEIEPGQADEEHVRGILQSLQNNKSLDKDSLASISKHVDIILDRQSEVKNYVYEITQPITEQETSRIFQSYGNNYKLREFEAARYRFGLLLVSLALIAYVVRTLFILQRAQRTLTESVRELNFQKYALDQHAIVSIADHKGKILYVNEKFSQISQYSRDELVGKDHRVINSKYHPADFFKVMWATISQGKVWHGVVKNRRKDGSYYWVDSTIVPFLNDNKKIERYVSIRSDITEKKLADELLNEQREFYENITEALGEGLYVQDKNGICIYLNAEAERLLGWSRNELLGRDIHSTIHHLTSEGHPLHQLDCPILKSTSQTGSVYLDDQVFVRKDGSIFPVAIFCRTQMDALGLAKNTVVAFSDITLRKQTEQAMLLAKEAAEKSNQIKSDFLANMSHEIRTPMNGIIGMTNLALETELSLEQREYLGLVKSSADALLGIINDILDFSKIEAGKVRVERIAFSVESTMRELMKTMALRAQDKGLELVFRLDPKIPEIVQGDPGRIRQVLINLIGNAIKFTEHGEIEVQVLSLPAAPQGCVRLYFEVRDTGIGIPKDRFAAIFDSFTQANTSTTRRYGGTGLGLTISSQLVALMGGHIDLESEEGRGSRFYFSLDLPLVSEAMDSPSVLRFKNQLTGQRVLVVDDNATNRKLLTEQLMSWHMQPTAVASGPEALSEFKRARDDRQPYAMTIIDMQMPDMDGFELAQHLAGADSELPPVVMMLTSRGQRGDAERCRELGIRAYLTKPALPSDLLGAIQNLIGETSENTQTPGDLITRHSLRENRRSLKLLLAEDNAVNQRLAQAQLSRQGHEVVLAVDGRQAIDYWSKQKFDAVLMDVHMPEINGYEATAIIRQIEAQEHRERTPIIAMTAHAMQGARETCMQQGMDGYVSKPIEFEQLWAELENVLTPLPLADQANQSATRTGGQTAVSASVALPVADLKNLREMVNDDASVFNEIRSLLQADAPKRVEMLEQALTNADMAAVQSHAHALVGMVGAFGAAQAQSAARLIELDPQASDLPQKLEALKQAVADLLAEVNAYVW